MAGDWIKMRGNLWDDPRVSRLVDMTDSTEAAIVGALYWLWATADQHTEDGVMHGLTMRGIDRKTGVAGFAGALVAIGWLADNGDSVTILNFEDHNGASAKSRIQTAKRVANHKANGKVTVAALPEQQDAVTDALPREEKRREEKKRNTKEAQAPFVLPDWINQQHWDVWHQHPKRKGASNEQKQLAVDKLAKWRDEGQDFAGALENAAVGGTQGIFLPNKPFGGGGKQAALEAENRRAADQFAGAI